MAIKRRYRVHVFNELTGLKTKKKLNFLPQKKLGGLLFISTNFGLVWFCFFYFIVSLYLQRRAARTFAGATVKKMAAIGVDKSRAQRLRPSSRNFFLPLFCFRFDFVRVGFVVFLFIFGALLPFSLAELSEKEKINGNGKWSLWKIWATWIPFSVADADDRKNSVRVFCETKRWAVIGGGRRVTNRRRLAAAINARRGLGQSNL